MADFERVSFFFLRLYDKWIHKDYRLKVEIVIQIVLKFWFTVPWQLGSTILGTLL